MKRQLSSQAQVAKLCRQFCKSKGIKCRATSDSFSMGDSVDVDVYDQPPAVMNMLKDEFAKYQYGSFNGMEDIYEYSNSRDDIPQTKYLSVNNRYSDELEQAAWDYIKANFSDAEDLPAVYKDVSTNAQIFNEWANSFVYQVLNGYREEFSKEFWDSYLNQENVA